MDQKITTEMRIAKMLFASVYPLYCQKIEKKGRSIEELNQVIEWLTGYTAADLQLICQNKITFKDFFDQCQLNPAAEFITGTICGYRIEDIQEPLHKKVRYLDKIVDELAKGRSIEKIQRKLP